MKIIVILINRLQTILINRMSNEIQIDLSTYGFGGIFQELTVIFNMQVFDIFQKYLMTLVDMLMGNIENT